jgi:D-aspartate ligase
MKNITKNATAVVMGLLTNGLSVARALGRRGVKVIGVHRGKRPVGSYSRFLTYVREPQTGSERDRLNFFLSLWQNLKSPIVILPTLDHDVMFLSRNRDILEKNFLFLLPPHNLLEFLTSKIRLIEIAERYRIPLPPSIRISHKSELKEINSNFFPCVLKPEDQNLWRTKAASKMGIKGLKAIPVMNKSELSTQYKRVSKVDDRLVVQKMIVGSDDNEFEYHALVDSNDRIIGEFVGKKLRLTPAHFGMACLVESVHSDKVINEGRRILRLLHYKGMAGLDFKIDERDGRLYFLELNPRFSLWTGLDVICGVDFPNYYFNLCLGEKISPKENYLIGKKWLDFYSDIKNLRTLLKEGSLTSHQWVKSVINADAEAVYAIDDPLPAIITHFLFLKNQIGNIIFRNRS